MGKTILTPKQLKFLELVQKDSQITKRFYLTGGTALAEFYLKHRLSEDIDLFCEVEEVDQVAVSAFLEKISQKLSVKQIKRSQFLGLVSFILDFDDGDVLKVDFNYYPFPRIDRGVKFGKLEVDSLRDIAVNKLHTIFMQARSRDFVDLYFILKQENYLLDELIIDAKTKFDWHIDSLTLGSQFERVGDYQQEYPRILLPFSQKEMEEFYRKLAKSLAGDIFK